MVAATPLTTPALSPAKIVAMSCRVPNTTSVNVAARAIAPLKSLVGNLYSQVLSGTGNLVFALIACNSS